MDNGLRARILDIFSEVYMAHTQSVTSPDMLDDTALLATGLDSLGYAILVFRLEEALGYDPFSLSESACYPRTFGEFVRFYEDNAPR